MEQQNEIKHQSRTRLLTTAGILLIISSIIAKLGGLFFLNVFLMQLRPFLISAKVYSEYNLFAVFSIVLLIGVFGILGFVFGLKAGIQTLKRKRFSKSIFRAFLLLLIYGLQFFGQLFVLPFKNGAIPIVTFLGAPITVLSLLGLICLAMSKKEFLQDFI